ncbi:hypothetical protein [Mycobacterium asiaticum]|uniref:hypothetical protein n=1 Tax=Mycobacterium asiaticum TaxID=1790 RepID=UPI000B283B7C|nr:hypothetical protein [Mycobacterium asiaticum]
MSNLSRARVRALVVLGAMVAAFGLTGAACSSQPNLGQSAPQASGVAVASSPAIV